jgi:hypothetical protein
VNSSSDRRTRNTCPVRVLRFNYYFARRGHVRHRDTRVIFRNNERAASSAVERDTNRYRASASVRRSTPRSRANRLIERTWNRCSKSLLTSQRWRSIDSCDGPQIDEKKLTFVEDLPGCEVAQKPIDSVVECGARAWLDASVLGDRTPGRLPACSQRTSARCARARPRRARGFGAHSASARAASVDARLRWARGYLPRPVAPDIDAELQRRFKSSRCIHQRGLLLMLCTRFAPASSSC